ncbi:MAG: MlaE family ABC transporter permease, partial [Cyclonatronaceae bacterium]
VPAADFLFGARSFFLPWDIIFGVLKSIVFGFVITSISCYKGYYASGGAEGVGTATTDATVMSCIFILVSDLILALILL